MFHLTGKYRRQFLALSLKGLKKCFEFSISFRRCASELAQHVYKFSSFTFNLLISMIDLSHNLSQWLDFFFLKSIYVARNIKIVVIFDNFFKAGQMGKLIYILAFINFNNQGNQLFIFISF